MVDNNNENSHFNKYYLAFKGKLTKNDYQKFKNLHNCQEWFKFIKNITNGKEFEHLKRKEKNRDNAINLKNKGNHEFQQGNVTEALKLYNESLFLHPFDENKSENSIIRANRSAALYELEEFQLALIDIEKALKNEYPNELRYKIVDRKAKCLLALKQHQKAIQAFRETITALDDSKLTIERRQKWQKDIQIMLAVMTKNKAVDEKLPDKSYKCKIKGNRNKVYTSASNLVDINFSETMGRYAIAAEEIPCGEVIVHEKAYCSVLLNERIKTHCFQCFKRIISGEPCPTCASVKFCSDKCKNTALSTHHKYECQILDTLWSSGISVTCLMSLRIITQSNVEFFLKIRNLLKEEGGLWTNQEYNSSNFLTVYQLVRHEQKRTVADLMHRAYMALFLLSCLKQTDYFANLANKDLEDAEVLIGGLFMRFLQILQFNAHEISELDIKSSDLKDWKSIFIGGGLYPTLALFNHSCEPGIVRYFQGSKIVVRSVKRIKQGEMIAENYGPIFTVKPRKERQSILMQQYWFSCSCIPCVNNWPMLEYMDPNQLRFHCDNPECNNVLVVGTDNMNISIICRFCAKQTNIMKGLKALQDSESLFRLGESLMQSGEIEKALNKFLELYNILIDNLVPPFRDYYLCQQRIRSCFLSLGNMTAPMEKLKKLLKK